MGVYIKGIEMPKSCEECGLYREYTDGIFPISSFYCEITKKKIGIDYKETLPKWCPIDGSVPKEPPKQSEEEKKEIEMKNGRALWEIRKEWGL